MKGDCLPGVRPIADQVVAVHSPVDRMAGILATVRTIGVPVDPGRVPVVGFIVPLALELHFKFRRCTVERGDVLDFERPHCDHFRIVSHPAERRW